MATEPQVFPNAIYATYMTGRAGTTGALLVFRDGAVAGADSGQGQYDGEYWLAPDHRKIVGSIKVTLPAGVPTITGVLSAERPLSFDVPFQLPVELDPDEIYRIETPTGPVNARFKRLRALSV